MKNIFQKFMDNMCPGCYKECVTKKEVKECMSAFNDFVDHYLEGEINEIKDK